MGLLIRLFRSGLYRYLAAMIVGVIATLIFGSWVDRSIVEMGQEGDVAGLIVIIGIPVFILATALVAGSVREEEAEEETNHDFKSRPVQSQ